jgi:threonine dehydratase
MEYLLSSILVKVLRAALRLDGKMRRTPLVRSEWLSSLVPHSRVLLKCEHQQATGSFKARGSLNKFLSLSQGERQFGIITASSGNHGLGVARASAMTGVRSTIVLPRNASPSKVQAIKRLAEQSREGLITLEFVEGDALAAEQAAIARSEVSELTYISPYNDAQVIGGQGTVAVEAVSQFASEHWTEKKLTPEIHHAFITVGGGGLVSGVGTYLKALSPTVKIWGCMPEVSPEMALWVRSGTYTTVQEQATLSDASAGAPEEASITYNLCKQLVDEFALVAESTIADIMRRVWHEEGMLVEGSAAVAVAAYIAACTQAPEEFIGRTTMIVLCGGNLSDDVLRQVFMPPVV